MTGFVFFLWITIKCNCLFSKHLKAYFPLISFCHSWAVTLPFHPLRIIFHKCHIFCHMFNRKEKRQLQSILHQSTPAHSGCGKLLEPKYTGHYLHQYHEIYILYTSVASLECPTVDWYDSNEFFTTVAMDRKSDRKSDLRFSCLPANSCLCNYIKSRRQLCS